MYSGIVRCYNIGLYTQVFVSFSQWVGQGRGFATLDSISDPLLLTKYNALLHRAQLLGKAEVLVVTSVCMSES